MLQTNVKQDRNAVHVSSFMRWICNGTTNGTSNKF